MGTGPPNGPTLLLAFYLNTNYTKNTNMICPKSHRVLISRISNEDVKNANGIVLPGQLKAGENLFVGNIVHPGDTKFTKDQIVYYSEYSASSVTDMSKVLTKEGTRAEAKTYYVVAEDDIMAYEEPTKA